jgi:hypothetical protein
MGWTNTQPDIITLPFGATSGARVVLDGTRDVILVYNSAGQLFASMAAASGNDGLGNSYPAGVKVGVQGSAGAVLSTGADGLTGIEYFPGIVANILNDAKIQLNVVGAGTGQHSFLTIASAEDATQQDIFAMNVSASSADGTNNAQITLNYQGSDSVVHRYLLASLAGVAILAGSVTAVDPSTGTSRANPAAAETWHTATVTNANWTASGAAQPLRYRREGIGAGTVRLSGELLTTGVGPWVANSTLVSLGSNYAPTVGTPFVTRSDIAVAAGQATVNVLSTGSVQNGQAFTAAGQRLFFDGVTFPID